MYDSLKCKVILLGDSGVGKTSIISRLINKYEKNPKSTISTEYTIKEEIINNEKILFELWDTVGQEKYLSLNRIFYLDAKICIIVYDITNKKSYDNAINIWLKEIQNYTNEKIIIGLAGNKCDLYQKEQVNENEVRNFCSLNDIEFNLTSTYLNLGIDNLFMILGKKYFTNFREKENEKSIYKDSSIITISSKDTNNNKSILSNKQRCC